MTAPLPLAIVLLIVGVYLAVFSRRWPFPVGVSADMIPVAARASARIRLRNTVAALAALAVGIVFAVIGLTSPSDLGRSLLVAPIAAATAGVAFFAIVPTFVETITVRRAELVRRSALSFVQPAWLAVATGLAVALAASAVAFGVAAEPDGRSIGNDYGRTDISGAAGPFPGFYYGVPSVVALVLLVVAVAIALYRLSTAPAPSDESLRVADTAIRSTAASVVLRAAAAGVALSFGLLLTMAATATLSVNHGFSYGEVGNELVAEPMPLLQAIALVEAAGAAVTLLGGLGLGVAAVTAALRRPISLTPIAQATA